MEKQDLVEQLAQDRLAVLRYFTAGELNTELLRRQKEQPLQTRRNRSTIYVSLPISGRDFDAVKQRGYAIREVLENEDVEVVLPFEIAPEKDMPYSYYMGKCIEALLDCDVVYFVHDWYLSKGCQCEHATAVVYGKTIKYQTLNFDL